MPLNWESGFSGNLPAGNGVVRHQDVFDNLFFRMSGSQAQKTEPQLRFLLELSYEALVDANMDAQGGQTLDLVGPDRSKRHQNARI